MTKCPNWNSRELEEALLPSLMNCVSAEILQDHVKKQAIDELEQVRAAMAEDKRALANMLGIVERSGGSDSVAQRIRELDAARKKKAHRVVELQALINDPVTELWEDDLDRAVMEALRAVRDVTRARMAERAALHQSFIRVVERIWVWPRSHAAVKVRGNGDAVFMPIAATGAVAMLAGMPSPLPSQHAAAA